MINNLGINLIIVHLGDGHIDAALETDGSTLCITFHESSEVAISGLIATLQCMFPSDHPNMIYLTELLEKAKKFTEKDDTVTKRIIE